MILHKTFSSYSVHERSCKSLRALFFCLSAEYKRYCSAHSCSVTLESYT